MSTPLPVIGSTVTDALRWLDLTGVFANALLGGIVARWRHWVLPQNYTWNAVWALRSGYRHGTQRLHNLRELHHDEDRDD